MNEEMQRYELKTSIKEKLWKIAMMTNDKILKNTYHSHGMWNKFVLNKILCNVISFFILLK